MAGRSRVVSNATMGGKSEPLRAEHDTRLADELGFSLLHHFPDIAFDAAALSESVGDRADNVPMAVGEEKAPEELGRALPSQREQPARDQIARCAVGIGKGVYGAANIIECTLPCWPR